MSSNRDLAGYYNQYTEKNFDHILSDFRKQLVVDAIKRYQARRILEVGCGTNPLFTTFNDFDHLTIIEPAEGFAKVAAEALANDYARLVGCVEIINTTIQDYMKPDSDIDFIICAGLLGEFEKPGELMEALFETAKNDTLVHVSAPNKNSFHRLLALEAGIIDNLTELSTEQQRFQRFHVFGKDDMVTLANSVGFEVLECGTYYLKPFTNSQMMAILEGGIIDEKVLRGLNRMSKYIPDFGAEVFINIRKRQHA